MFLPVGFIEFAQPHDFAHDLRVKAVTLGFGIDFADIVCERYFLFLKALDTFNEALELARCESRFGHVVSRDGMSAAAIASSAPNSIVVWLG